jgi:hypothetical protein
MNGRSFRYSIVLARPQRREMPGEIGQKFLNTLDALSTVDPLFTQWKLLDFATMAKLPLAAARPRITTIVENNVVRDDYDQPEPKRGYTAIGLTDNHTASRIVKLTADAGAVFPGSTVMLEIGGPLAPTDPAVVNYALFRKALLAITAHWQPAWSYACSACITGKRRSFLARR